MSDKAAGGSAKSYDYFGTLAATFGYGGGGVEAIVGIYLDGERVYPPDGAAPLLRSAPGVGNPHEITIADFGRVRIYWGEPGQPTDPTLSQYGEHPAYDGLFYCVFVDCKFGRERDTMPNVQVAYRRRPVQAVVTGPAAALDAEGQAGLVAAAAEVLTSPWGLAWPVDRVDASGWQAVAEAVEADLGTAGGRVSILLSERGTARQFLASVRDLADVWLRVEPDGRLSAGRWPAGGGAAAELPPGGPGSGAAPVLDANAWSGADALSWDAPGRDELPTGYDIRFPDAAKEWKESGERVDHLAAWRASPDGPQREQLRLPWITQRDRAGRVGMERLRRRLAGDRTSKVRCRPERARRLDGSPLRPGDYCWVDADPIPGGDGELWLCRVVDRSDPPSGPVELELAAEPYAAAVAWMPDWSAATPSPEVVAPLYYQRTIALPPVSGQPPQVYILAMRSGQRWVGVRVWFSLDGVDYAPIGDQRRFSLPVQLPAAVSEDASTVRVEVLRGGFAPGVPADLSEGMLRDLVGLDSDAQAADDRWLLVLVRKNPATGAVLLDGQEEWVEICSVAGVQAVPEGPGVAAGTYDVRVMRGRLRTRPRAFDVGPWPDAFFRYEAWLVDRAGLVPMEHGWFRDAVRSGQLTLWRYQPYTRRALYDPAEAWAEAQRRSAASIALGEFAPQTGAGWAPTWGYSLPPAHYRAPIITWAPLAAGGVVGADGRVDLDIEIIDHGGDLVSCVISALSPGAVAGGEVVLREERLGGVHGWKLQESVVLPAGAGWHTLSVEAVDVQGLRAREARLVRRATSAGTVAPPHISPAGGNPTREPVAASISFGLSPVPAGWHIEHRLAGGPWQAAAVGVEPNVSVRPGVLLEARVQDGAGGVSAITAALWPWDMSGGPGWDWAERPAVLE